MQLDELEVTQQLQENDDTNKKSLPTLSRADICSNVELVWKALPHGDIADVGYRQTGADLPLEGPIYRSDIARDLIDVISDIDPHDDPTMRENQVGTAIRDEAKKLVDERWLLGALKDWHDAELLIGAQDMDDPPLPEGLEGIPFVRVDDDDDDDDNDDGGGGGDCGPYDDGFDYEIDDYGDDDGDEGGG